MTRLAEQQDAYGQAIWDHLSGKESCEIVERDDGFFGTSAGAPAYFATFRQWPAHQRKAIRLARGCVLDVGCGAGRVALHLQEKGLRVTGIDVSPLAVKTCKARGVKDARVLSITQLTRRVGLFDTIVMYGNNFGLFGGPRRAKWLLRRFHHMTSDGARIIAESMGPGKTQMPCHLAYHRLNRSRGRLPGQLRIRIRYQKLATPWFDYLLVSPEEMRDVLAGAGWRIARLFESEGPAYVAVIQKEQAT